VLRKVESVRNHTSIRDINSAYGEDLIDNPWPVARQIRGSKLLLKFSCNQNNNFINLL